jgi:hypothetical protein
LRLRFTDGCTFVVSIASHQVQGSLETELARSADKSRCLM